MKIKSITIKGIRGLKDLTITLDMIPNKPSLLVAPNGSGKSSFAIAFQSLIRGKIKIDTENLYLRDQNRMPGVCVVVEYENGATQTLTADTNSNDISKEFDIAVINNRVKPEAIRRHVNNTTISTARMSIEPIVLEKIPKKVSMSYDFGANFNVDLKKGVVPSVNNLLKNNKFLSSFPIEALGNSIATTLKKAMEAVDKIKSYDMSKKKVADIKIEIEYKVLPILKRQTKIQVIVDLIKKFLPSETELNKYLMAMQIFLLYEQNKASFKDAREYARYNLRREEYKDKFNSLNKTWQDIKPKEQGGYLIVDIPNVTFLSNGERDIIVFIAMLEKARQSMKKETNILIIDEVFDYLDDANLVAAQYYVTQFIHTMKSEGRKLFPIILTHLNPDFYKNYAFSDLKVYYLKPLPKPDISNLMLQLLRKRKDLNESNSEDVISKYMLHYFNDYKQDLSSVLNKEQINAGWNDISKFKEFCMRNYVKYVANEDFCPIAVCVVLREWIESYCYKNLLDDKKEEFLEKKKTKNKMNYAQDNGVDVPETFRLLGLIYNNPLHVTGDGYILRQTLFSRLQNNTIRSMIKHVEDLCSKK